MRRPGRRWVHAARVALGATAVVAVVAIVIALIANLVIVQRLDREVDTRLMVQLEQAAKGASVPVIVSPGDEENGDLDDAPTFTWRVDPAGGVTDLTIGAPPLPAHDWSGGSANVDHRWEHVSIHTHPVRRRLAGGRGEHRQDRPDSR